MERLLTQSEVAERYSIHPKTVPRMEEAQRIPPRVPGWVGRRPRWRERDIDQHIADMCEAARAEQVA
jgi:predicted DNA-binding transcriptional regulator AlpA